MEKLIKKIKENKREIFTSLIIFLFLYGFRRLVWQKIVPISTIQSLIENQKFRRVILGNILLVALLKDRRGYVISAIEPRTP